MDAKNLTAFIFAAGFGTRLRPLTDKVPKSLVPINNKPIIEYTIEWYIQLGVKKIVINTHYLADQFTYLPDKFKNSIEIVLLKEEEILGHAGALYAAQDIIATDNIIASNADTIIRLSDSDLTKMINNESDVNLCLFDKGNTVLGFDTNNQLIRVKDNLFLNHSESFSSDYAGVCTLKKSALKKHKYSGKFESFFGPNELMISISKNGGVVNGIFPEDMKRFEITTVEDVLIVTNNILKYKL